MIIQFKFTFKMHAFYTKEFKTKLPKNWKVFCCSAAASLLLKATLSPAYLNSVLQLSK